MRLLTLLLIVMIGFAAAPASAQAAVSPLDWIPADFEGFLRVDLSRPNDTLRQLNTAYFAASYLQPARAGGSPQRALDDYFPVDLFDTEGAAFETTVLPWLAGEFVIAYRSLGADFVPDSDDILLILPTEDAFAAASVLSAVTRAQDLPSRTRYAGVTIFVGDRTALAFTPAAVLVGDEPVLHAAIDAMNGDGARLVDSTLYATLADASEGWPVFAYLGGDAPQHALSVLLKGDSSAQPVLRALGDALQSYNADSLEAALLSGAVDAVGVGLRADGLRGTLEAQVVVQTGISAEGAVGAATESSVMAYIPRNAMLVQQGANARSAFYDALVVAPASGYFNGLLSSAFAGPAAAGTPVAPTAEPPDAETIGEAVGSFVSVLSGVGGFDLDNDLATHLDGGYALALLPRPNNPAPGSGAPYDVLLVAETADADAALAGATTLARTVFALDDDAFSDAEGDARVRSVYSDASAEPLLQLGAVDGTLMVGTGGAVEAALRAGTGDNRLVSVSRWQDVSRRAEPMLYLDLNALLATFAPTAGGPVDSGIGQLGLSVQHQGEGRYEIDVIVTLPALM